jgi:hypothetical protein
LSSKICSASIQTVAGLVAAGVDAGQHDTLVFDFAVYRVGNALNLKDIASNHQNFEIEVELPVDRRKRESAIYDRLMAVLDESAAKLKPKQEIAIGNRVIRKTPGGAVFEWNLAFGDYKSQDYDAVVKATKTFSRFNGATILKTDASFHTYNYPTPNKKMSRSAMLATEVLTQREVIDVDWAMISILRNEAYLRVSHNFKGDIVLAPVVKVKIESDFWDGDDDWANTRTTPPTDVLPGPKKQQGGAEWTISQHGPWTMAVSKKQVQEHKYI